MTDYRGLLAELAVPRLAGTFPAEQVRAVLKRELVARGFVVMEHRFTGRSLLHRLGRVPLAGVNLIAVRPRSPARVATWLVAHYDSKGQPLSMAARLGAAALAGVGAVELLGLALRAVLGGVHPSLLDGMLGGAGVVGAALLVVNRVTDRSAGAVDNAAGVITAFATVDALPPDVPVGLILPDAEEYGLLGARALVRERAHLLADTTIVNFDGIDDRGLTIALLHRAGATVDRVARTLAARRARWLPVLVDGLALAATARECVTIMRGNWSTARVVHTLRDTAARLTLDGARRVAGGVAAALFPG
ncbi:MAG TPA: M28 family peptidase [Gemmatimonadales bacterium]|nr:M28 family peptidase [Gemmatimonadales bacterium]